MKKIILGIFACMSLTVFGQSANNSNSFGSGFRLAMDEVDGHPFLINDWYQGNLVKNDGSVTEKMPLNYNLLENAVATTKMLNGQKTYVKLNNADYSGFMITDDKNNVHLYKKILGPEFTKAKKEDKFYLIVDAPNNSILLETNKKFKDPNASGWSAATTTNKRGKYVESTEVYVKTSKGTFSKVKLNNKDITKVLDDKGKELKDFIASKKLKIKEAADLIPVMTYYRTLK